METDYDTDELDAVMNAMILNDQQPTFLKEYRALQLGKSLNKSTSIVSLPPFFSKDGRIKMQTRSKYCDNIPEQVEYPVILDHQP